MQPLAPTDTAELFRPLSALLVSVLRELTPDEWLRPTVAGSWRVRDVAAHLLDGQLRRISAQRDAHLTPPDQPIRSDRDLTSFVNALNATGVAYGARLSTRVLTDLLEQSGQQLADLVARLDPYAPAIYAVSWAGEHQSQNWMDTGREYTEHWHHQMQIRDAVGRVRLLDPKWLEPLLDMSARALPHAYAAVAAPAGTVVTFNVTGETAGAWSLLREADRWQMQRGHPPAPNTTVTIAADDVWRMFYNALSGDALLRRVKVEGNADLAGPLLRARSVIV